MRCVQAFLLLTTALSFPTAAPAAPSGAAPAKPFRDCPDCPDMVSLPAGSFAMGIDPKDPVELERARFSTVKPGRASPLHTVTFKQGFAMGQYPVTIAQFRAFVNDSGYEASKSCYSSIENDGHLIYENVRGTSWRDPGFPQDDRHPVVCVSGEDADAYAAWLSKKTGHKYVVPNEAQYEYALRAGTTTAYFWGNDRDKGCEYSNQPDLDQGKAYPGAPMGHEYRFQCSDGYAWTSPVGIYKPNPWGLYDMAGNIWEWTSDCWNDNYNGAPTDGSTWRQGDCDGRPTRGGSHGNAALSAYSAIRAPRYVAFVGHSWGFRVARND